RAGILKPSFRIPLTQSSRKPLGAGSLGMPTTYTNARPAVDVTQAKTLPQEFYTDPGLFRREMEAIHFDMWLAAGRLEQLSQPGDFFVCEIANASVIVLRDESSSIHAFHI